jgi:endogenous inhibitor of DNA gyrase (YacG/DUF329 family)
MIIKCPRCGEETEYKGNPFRPFCSERCKLIDLGGWLSGTYRIPTKNQHEDEDGEPIPQKNPEKE